MLSIPARPTARRAARGPACPHPPPPPPPRAPRHQMLSIPPRPTARRAACAPACADPRPGRTVRGFTLIELLVVLAILTLLAGLVGPRVLNQLGGAKAK